MATSSLVCGSGGVGGSKVLYGSDCGGGVRGDDSVYGNNVLYDGDCGAVVEFAEVAMFAAVTCSIAVTEVVAFFSQ